MKRFFKTSAIIACLAMLSVACDRVVESDDTVYEGTPIVPASSINELFPGNGKIYVEWEVSDNDNVSSTKLSWDDGNGTSGTYTMEGVAARDIKDLTIYDLPAGTYSVSLENLCDIDVLTIPVSRSVTVFDEDTYKSSTAIEATQIVHNGTSATIYWEEAQEDCVGVIITYKQWGVTVTSSLLSVYSGVTTLLGADDSQDISYITCYQPEIAIEGDYVTKSSADKIPSPSPDAPTALYANPGDEKMKVSWSVDTSNEYLYKTVIKYGLSSSSTTKTVTIYNDGSDTGLVNGANEVYIDGLTAGEYSIEVYNSGEADDSMTASVYTNYINVYDLESLQASYESSMPTVSAAMINSIVYVTVTQSTTTGSVDCDIVTFNYQAKASVDSEDNRRTVDITDFSEPYPISSVVENSKYTYSVTFTLPDGALDSATTIDKHGTYEDTYSSWYTLPSNIVTTD